MSLRILVVAIGIGATLTMTSCASPYDEATKDGLRQQVVAVAEASAAGYWNAAVTSLDALTERLSEARAAGEVSEERFDSILRAMELVRQDLDAAIAAAADAAERQRLIDEQARLQEQIAELQNQPAQQTQPNQQKDEPGEKDDGDKGGDKGKESGGKGGGKGAEEGKGK